VTRDAIEGFVIAVDHPRPDRAALEATLCDRFVVRPDPTGH
jgi:hypothetical protein